MAKSARASTVKTNNQRLKKNVLGQSRQHGRSASAMDVDGAKPASKRLNKKIEKKRRGKKSSIVFPMRGPKRNKK
ncbi:hypothetical protein MMYC01_208759 [Madurella mycetomatis]|uniref:DUF2423 domain-containing protein n=1 Tax=Madurella mycetomatis TaxID=100816 RepID=A0A175VP93_9PEZI|nr:hypothetical protein MMYC01_208759 [Madurella mycetomatis]